MTTNDNKLSEPRQLACWTIELNVECPKCGDYVDLLDSSDFWDGRKLEIGEQKKAVEVSCPRDECHHDFLVDLTY